MLRCHGEAAAPPEARDEALPTLLENLLAQGLAGLASASSLFLVAAGLSLIFGVTRIVNFAHGSLYMLGVYLAYTIVTYLLDGPLAGMGVAGFWLGVLLAALCARGTTTIRNIGQIDRGYERVEEKLRELGAVIRREPVPT